MTAMTSTDIKAALALRWPDVEYQRIEEAPQDAARQGRKIDLLVISLWRSRGHEIDAVEIKVSMSDWKRELDNPDKADWWWQHSHRYWIACPVALSLKIRDQLPPTWGLLAVGDSGSKIVVAAPRHERVGFTWDQTIGLVRGAADAGPNMLARAFERGRTVGVAEGKERAGREAGDGFAKASLAELQRIVSDFETASGLNIRNRFEGGHRLGEVVKLVNDWAHHPDRITKSLHSAADQMVKQAESARELANAIAEATR